jgi:hypothetical protein
MQEFIRLATTVLGMTEEAARGAAGALLGFLSSTVPGAELQKLLSRIPGASELLKAVQPVPPPPPPGILESLGDLVTNATSAVQGAVGSGVALVNLFAQIGLDPQKGVEFFKLFVGFARQQAGAELVDAVIGKIPGAKSLLS